MVRALYEDFLQSDDAYFECVRFWQSLIDDVASSLGQAGMWERWIPLHYANGRPFELDGNPIFDGQSEDLDRAFRIIQHQAEGSGIELVAWLKSYGIGDTALPRDELVINMSLSEESSGIARNLLKKWMMPTTKVVEMQNYLEEILPPTSN